MKFDYIYKIHEKEYSGYIDSKPKFYSFVKEFNIVGVHWSQPTSISASYFLRLLQKGSSARARGYGKYGKMNDDEHSDELDEYYLPLLDHGAMWRTKNRSVICTAMPYGDSNKIKDSFYRMVERFGFPESVKLQFLEDKYRFRSNGDYMILIYDDSSRENFALQNCLNEDIQIDHNENSRR